MALYEALFHSRVEAGLRVPVIHGFPSSHRWAIHMDCIEGKTLAQVMKDDPANKDKYISDMVDIQIEIHSKQAPKLSKLKDKMTRQINSLDCIDDATKYERSPGWTAVPSTPSSATGILRRKTSSLNENGTYRGLVAARQGNASADVGPTYLLLSPARSGYGGKNISTCSVKAHQHLEKICAGVAPPIVAAAQLTENKPEERDLLMEVGERCRLRIRNKEYVPGMPSGVCRDILF